MRLIGLMLARNEEWIIGLSARVALLWCDALVVLNHASTDGTEKLLKRLQRDYPDRVQLLSRKNPEWEEMDFRQAMLETARRWGASHVAVVDADEIITGNIIPHVHAWTKALRPSEGLSLPMHCMWRGIGYYRTDASCVWSTSVVPVAFPNRPEGFWKKGTDGYQFHRRPLHGISWTFVNPLQNCRTTGGVMHLQFAVWHRLCAKQAWYKMTERVRWPNRDTADRINQRYDHAVNEQGLEVTITPRGWFEPYSEWMPFLNLWPTSWHEQECNRLWDQYGPMRFEGLNLFGVVGKKR